MPRCATVRAMQVGRPLAKGQRSRPWLLALRALGAAAIVALCVLGLRRIDWRATGAALAGASVPLLALASLTIFTELLVKAERFRLLLAPVQRLPLAKLFYYIIVSYAASMLLPGPVGATLRVYVLERRHAVPVAASIAALLFEKLFEGIGLVFVVAGLPFLLPLPRAVSLLIAGVLEGPRATIGSTNVALFLAVVVVAAGVLGRRAGGWITALGAALSFNFFHTRPVHTLRIASGRDVITVVLLAALGGLAGELAHRRQTACRQLVRIDLAVDEPAGAVRSDLPRRRARCPRPAARRHRDRAHRVHAPRRARRGALPRRDTDTEVDRDGYRRKRPVVGRPGGYTNRRYRDVDVS